MASAVPGECGGGGPRPGRVGGGVLVGDGGADGGDDRAVDVDARGPECVVGVAADPHDGERWVGRPRRVDGVEHGGEGAAAEVEGVVVGHGRHVDARGGERVEGGGRRLERVALAGLGTAADADGRLEVDDGEVGGGQRRRRWGQRVARGRRAGPAARPRSGRRRPTAIVSGLGAGAGVAVGSGVGVRDDDSDGGDDGGDGSDDGSAVGSAPEHATVAASRATPAATRAQPPRRRAVMRRA